MMYLIDTHVLLWHISGDSRLTKRYLTEIENESNTIYISKGSLWEIAIKVSTGKLKLTKSISELEGYLKDNKFEELEFNYKDLEKVSELPFHHYDPFDRLIISQAITRAITIISDDVLFQHYPVQLLKK